MINRVTLHGRLTDTPELRHTAGDKAVCSFSIANDTGFGDKKVTHFFSCVAWGSMAEFLCKYFTKGQEIIVSGQLQTRQWFDRDGKKREVVEVLVRDADFCGPSGQRDGPSGRQVASSVTLDPNRGAAKTALPASESQAGSRAEDGIWAEMEREISDEDLPF